MELSSYVFQRASIDLLLDKVDTPPNSICCLSDLIHFNAIHNPHQTFCLQSKKLTNSNQEPGSIEVTFLQFSQAVERCCAWILSKIDETYPAELAKDGFVQKSQPVALYLESDLTLFIYTAALLTLNVPVRFHFIRRTRRIVAKNVT